MSLLVILAVWVVVSALVAPCVGYFLAGHRAQPKPPEADCGLGLQGRSRPRA